MKCPVLKTLHRVSSYSSAPFCPTWPKAPSSGHPDPAATNGVLGDDAPIRNAQAKCFLHSAEVVEHKPAEIERVVAVDTKRHADIKILAHWQVGDVLDDLQTQAVQWA